MQGGATITKTGDQIIQSDLEFRTGVEVEETIEFIRTDGVRMYIDVDKDSIPIALELVHPDDQNVTYETIQDDREGVERAIQRLFGFCSQMVNTTRMMESLSRNMQPSAALYQPMEQHRNKVLDALKPDLSFVERHGQACPA